MARGGARARGETVPRGPAPAVDYPAGRDAGPGMAEYLLAPPEVTVGLVGPHRLLQQIVLAAGLPGRAGDDARPAPADASHPDEPARPHQADPGSVSAGMNCRLVTAAYASEQSAPEKVTRLGAVDACLFASRAPLEYARGAGVLNCPATFIPLADGPLIATLLQAARDGIDPARASFDTFRRREVAAALAALQVPAQHAHVRENVGSAAAIAAYHARLWQLGQTTIAVTCLDEVARRLAVAKVPALTVRPSDHAVAAALSSAVLLARQSALAAARLAVVVVEVPDLVDDRSRHLKARQVRDELRLAVHQLLVREAHLLDAAVSQVSDSVFVVTGTSGSLVGAGRDEPPFAAEAARLLGIVLRVGVGTGPTQRAAEGAARRRLATTASVSTPTLRLAFPGSTTTGQPLEAASVRRHRAGTGAGRALDREPGRSAGSSGRLRSLQMLARLSECLAADAPLIVDAELVSRLLGVTPRTARRQLHALADEGLALALPPERSRHPGRPRQFYRLVVEKLSDPGH